MKYVRKILGFFDPLPLLYKLAADLHYKIQATSLTSSAFGGPPPPLSADII